ncbi:MAG: virulence-associated protein E, partial [Parasporobacterium sp.]|nr:virulence-associated protein E [Parasporobacterium sp.]
EMLAILHAKYVEETKSFISRLSDNYRIPYDKFSADHPRQCVFAGTSNRTEFLPPDKSGNRRFLPIEVNMDNAEVHILEDENASREYFLQLWAEVMEIYRSGNFSLTLSPDMQDALRAEQTKYMPEDPMETSILNYIEENQPQYVCAKLLFYEALGHYPSDTLETWQSNAIGEIMNQSLKTEYRKITSHKFKEYGIQRAWVRISEPVESDFMPLTPEQEKELPFK